MASDITLKKGGLSQNFQDALKEYYSSINIDGLYLDHKWRQWTEENGIITYIAERDGNAIGWLVYNPLHNRRDPA